MRKRVLLASFAAVVLVVAGAGLFALARASSVDHERSVSHRVERSVARSAALINYGNALEACEGRGNEGRENTLALARVLSKAERPELAAPAERVVYRMLHAQYSLPSGAIDCAKAIEKP
jgi:hypothetical protein